jgi:MFS family permease
MISVASTQSSNPSELKERWGIVAAGAVLLAVTSGVWYSPSVFFVALLQEFKREYAITAGIYSLFIAVYGLSGVVVGGLADRFGPRRLILVGGLLAPLGLAGNSLAPGIGSMYLTQGILAAAGLAAMGYVPVSVLLTQGFQRRRGLALGIASAGTGIGILVIIPLMQFLIDHIGWRLAYVAFAAICFAAVVPVALFAIPRPRMSPSSELEKAGGPGRPAGPSKQDWTVTLALCSREFWLVSLAFTFLNIPVQLVLTHHVAHLVEAGQSKAFVAGLVGLMGLVSILAKVTWGFLSDRWWLEIVYLAGVSCLIAAFVVLLLIGPATAGWVLFLYAVIMAFGYAVSPAMTPILSGRFFAGPHFGMIFGAVNILYHFGGATGVWLAGYVHDITGTYRAAFLGAILSAAATIGCVWLAAPRRLRLR